MTPDIPFLKNPYQAKKITVIEGPDASGKSHLVRKTQLAFHHTELDLRLIRCPNNYGDAQFRNVIMSEEVGQYSSAQAFLFLADMLYAFESQIKPYLDDPKVRFIFDRFLPSSCIYQGLGLSYLDYLFREQYPDFYEAFSEAHYIYLTPTDMEAHKARITKKKGEGDTNHLDPVSDEQILKQIKTYNRFSKDHQEYGLLGSHHVDIYTV